MPRPYGLSTHRPRSPVRSAEQELRDGFARLTPRVHPRARPGCDHRRLHRHTTVAPASAGATETSALQGGANVAHLGDPHFDTADFSDSATGNLSADDVLRRTGLQIADADVFWPTTDDPLFALVRTFPFPSSDHRLVRVDLAHDDFWRAGSATVRLRRLRSPTMATIRMATQVDIPTLARTYARAFADDPVIRWLVPDDDEYAAVGERLFAAPARRFLAQHALWCTDDGVAVAGWNLPGRPEVEVDDPDPIEHPEWRIERFTALRARMVEHAPPDEHWHLNILGTHPDWQRRGLGALLMAHTFAIADAAGLPCYLETETPANVAYYRRHGFEVRSEWDVGVPGAPGPHMWGMLRRTP